MLEDLSIGATGANLSITTASFGQTTQHGSAETFARSDHSHALPANPTPATVTQAVAEAGTDTNVFSWTAQRVKQACIAAVTSIFPTSSSTAATQVMPWVMTLPNTNLNDIRAPGFYSIRVATTNSPVTTSTSNADFANLIVQSGSNTRISQTFYHNNGQIWYRVLQNTTRTTWTRLTTAWIGIQGRVGKGQRD